MAPGPFLVTGLTGKQGGATAESLLAANATVHAIVRNPSSPVSQAYEKRGVKIFKGDFDDLEAIKLATAGTVGVFLNPYPTMQDPTLTVRHAENFINAAVAAGTVKTVVLSTSFNVGKKEYWEPYKSPESPLHLLYLMYSLKSAMEDALRAASLPHYTILRPSWLHHNYIHPFAGFHYPTLASNGEIAHAFPPGAAMPHLSPDDLGRFAAAALLDPVKFHHEEIDLGLENLTPEETAEILGRVSGRGIKARKMSEDEVKQSRVPTMMFHVVAGDVIDERELIAKYGVVKEEDVVTLEKYLVKNKDVFGKALGEPRV